MQRLALASLIILLALTACNRTESIGPSLEPSPAPPAALQSAPLADAGSPISHTASLFERLDATSVGIDFVHEWKPRNPYEANLLKTPFTGGGVAMGDYDGDGLCDVALTRPHGGLRLYRNRGDFRFEDVTEAAGVASNDRWTTGITFADVNHDGKLDLAVCSFDGANLLFMNQGGGRFQNQAHDHGLHFVGASVKMAFADYDRDGDLDAYLLTNRYEQRREVNVRYLGTPGHYTVAPEFQEMVGVINLPNGEQKFTKAAQADRLYHNDLRETGKLSFRDVTPRSGLHGFDHGLDITWWDFNQDGYPDIYIANDFTDPDRFYRNNGNGTFTEISQEALPSTPWFAMGSATGDINNDGQFDLLATDMAGTTHYRQKMAMGSMEAVAWFLDTAEPRQHMRNSLFLNTGTSRFLEVAQMTGLASTDWTWSVKLADLDLDGKEDVYITNGFTRDYLNSDFNLQLRSKGQEGNSLAWYDAPELREANLAFRNQGNMRFVNTAKAWGLDEVGISFGAALGDLDGDGDQDLVVINFSGPPSVYRNRSTASRVQVTLRGTRSNAEGIGAIVQAKSASTSQTRYVHPGNGFMSSNDSNLTIGLGSDEAIETLTVRWPSGATQQVANVRANQRITLAEPSAPSPPTTTPTSNTPDRPSPLFQDSSLLKHARHIERPYDDYVREPLLPNKLSQLGPGMAWADVDGDGDVDVYLGGAAGQSGQIFLQEEGRFDRAITTPFQQHAESEDMGCLFLDADCDGDLDLFVVSGGVESDAGVRDYQDRLYLQIDSDESGRPQWESRPERVPEEFDSGGPVAAADFDRDGDLDLFIGGRVVPGAYPTSPTSHLWRNDNGTFVEVTNELAPELVTPGMVTSCLWSDVDGDGWIDLLLATEYGPVRTFRNEKGQLRETTADAKLADMTGWWNSLAAADVDRDGDMDYLATNLGTNTKYHPSPEHPQVVFYGDFDNSGKRQIVEAKQTDSGLLPLRGRSCSSNAMPFLAKKFASYHAFASATLTDIYTESNLKNALRFEAVLAVTVMLINDGQGRFTSHVLPDLAQVSPGMGVQFLWANADEYPDLFIAQNFYSPQRETGRMNGGMGVLLLGNEAGSFSEVWPSQSGIIIPEDARSAAVVDLNQDGWQDVAVATNNGAPRLLLHKEMPADTPPMRLDCKGRLGNPTGVGVRVVTTTKSGRREVFETHAGGGYLTQAPTSIYVMSKPDDPAVSLTVRWPEGQQQIVPLSDPLSTIRVIEQP